MISTSGWVTGLDRAGLVISQRKLSSTLQTTDSQSSISLSLTLCLPAVSEKLIIVNIEQFPVVSHITRVTEIINILTEVISSRPTVGLVLQVLQGEGELWRGDQQEDRRGQFHPDLRSDWLELLLIPAKYFPHMVSLVLRVPEQDQSSFSREMSSSLAWPAWRWRHVTHSLSPGVTRPHVMSSQINISHHITSHHITSHHITSHYINNFRFYNVNIIRELVLLKICIWDKMKKMMLNLPFVTPNQTWHHYIDDNLDDQIGEGILFL